MFDTDPDRLLMRQLTYELNALLSAEDPPTYFVWYSYDNVATSATVGSCLPVLYKLGW